MKYVIGLIVIFAIAIGYNLMREKPAMPAADNKNTEMNSNMSEGSASDTSTVADYSPSDEELKMIHIMGNGEVMLGNGTVLADATINADGTITLTDGRKVTPMADYRQ